MNLPKRKNTGLLVTVSNVQPQGQSSSQHHSINVVRQNNQNLIAKEKNHEPAKPS